MAHISSKTLRRDRVLSYPGGFMECLSEAMIWEATLDYVFGEGRPCDCLEVQRNQDGMAFDKNAFRREPCRDKQTCAARWLAGGEATLSFPAACQFLGIVPYVYLQALEEIICAQRNGVRGAGTGLEGISSTTFRAGVVKGFYKAWAPKLEVMDWNYRHRVAKIRTGRKSGYFK